jgi:hypothetical protein
MLVLRFDLQRLRLVRWVGKASSVVHFVTLEAKLYLECAEFSTPSDTNRVWSNRFAIGLMLVLRFDLQRLRLVRWVGKASSVLGIRLPRYHPLDQQFELDLRCDFLVVNNESRMALLAMARIRHAKAKPEWRSTASEWPVRAANGRLDLLKFA